MVAFANPQDVADRWRPLTSDEESVAYTLIDDASDIILVHWPDAEARITAGTLSGASVTRVVAGMVKRAMVAGSAEGFESISETVGPFSQSGKLTNPNANLYLTAEDKLVFDGYSSQVARVGWLA